MSRKITITLIFFLFLLPFVSWYYLQSGLDWRKKAQAVMNGKKEFPELPFHTVLGLPLEKSEIENHVSLLILVSCDSLSSQMDLISRLYHQFKETHKANYFFIDTCSMASQSLPDTLKQNIYTINCNDSLHVCTPLLEDWPPGKTFALVDKYGIIRAYYAAHTHDEKKTLVEHMALLLPRDYSEKVQLKRDVEKK
jgi:hypothetical protein